MTERRGDQGFTVAPQRLGGGGGPGRPGRSRLRGIGLVVVLASAAAIVTIAWIGPRITDRPSFEISFFATPVPSPTTTPSPTPVELPGVATPLPAITRPDGPVPVGRIAVQTDSLNILDLATGNVTKGSPAMPGLDALFRSPDGDGWTCICLQDGEPTTTGSDRIMQINGIGPDGVQTDSTQVATFNRPVSDETGETQLASDVDVFDGGRRGLVAVGTRDGIWKIAIAALDVDGRKLGELVTLGTIASPGPGPSASAEPSPEPGNEYLDGPHVRVAPDGRVAFVWAVLQQFAGDGNPLGTMRAWRVTLGADGSIGKVTEAPGLLELPPFCSGVGFAAADRLAWLCPVIPTDAAASFDGTWQLGTLDLDGRPAGRALIPISADSYLEPLFDRANGQVYAWDPNHLVLARFDVHSLVLEQTMFNPLLKTFPGLAPGGGSEPVDWHRADSAVNFGSGSMTGSLDGARLYAVGFGSNTSADGNPPSLGIFAIDRTTLALTDRWAPAADYMTVTSLPGGLVAAAGLPSVKEDGTFAPWEGSVTVHDAADGRILVRFGRLGADNPPYVLAH